MARKATPGGYSSATVCAALGLSRTTFDAWILRGYLNLSPGPGTGRARSLTLLDAVRIATVDQLNRLGIAIGLAGRAAASIDHTMIDRNESGYRNLLFIAPSSRSADSGRLGSILKGPYKSLTDAEPLISQSLRDPAAFVVVDVSALKEQMVEALKEHDADR